MSDIFQLTLTISSFTEAVIKCATNMFGRYTVLVSCFEHSGGLTGDNDAETLASSQSGMGQGSVMTYDRTHQRNRGLGRTGD